MSQEFDPYYKWLKIPPSEQPPNHYRLLNTARFESDPDIIESAVARLVTLLQNVSTGDQAEYAQRILNDVAKARLCLSDPNLKAEYDEKLMKKLSGSSKKPVKTGRAETSDNAAKRRKSGRAKTAPGKARPGTKTAGKKRRPAAKKKSSSASKQKTAGSSAGLVIGYAVATVVVAGVALFFLFQQLSSRGTDSNDVAVETRDDDWRDETLLEDDSFDERQVAERNDTAAVNLPEDKLPAKTGTNAGAAAPKLNQSQTPKPAATYDSPATAAPINPPTPQPKTDSAETDQLLPHQLARFEAKLGEMVEFQGVPVSAGESSTGKTRYLRFSQNWNETIMVFMLTREVGDSLTVAELQKFVGKTVRINGLVERQFGTNRLGVKIQAKDQLEIIE